MFYGLLNLSLLGYIIATLILTHITIAGVTIYLHRHQAHRALELHPIASHFFRFWLWLTTGMITREWVAIHRKHHAKTETKDDPHSPQVLGLKKVLLEGAELYQQEARNKNTIVKYSYGTPDDWVENHIYTPRHSLGVALMFVLDLLLFGLPGITIWALQMMAIPLLAAGVVNGIGHYWGYRNFECPDASRNIVPLAILLCGEELHNNHHTYASSAKLSSRWWELDTGWLYIKLLSYIKLATVKKLPPQMMKQQEKNTIDLETVKTLFNNRFQLLSRYYKEVISPVYKAEKSQTKDAEKGIFKNSKRLLIREKSLLSGRAKFRLIRLLKARRRIKQVYYYRMQLQTIWTHTTSSQKELIEALQQWCKNAEASGIDALTRFAHNLKSYVPKPVKI